MSDTHADCVAWIKELERQNDEQREHLAARDAQIARLRKDAQRWRWLRQNKSLQTDRLKPTEWDAIADKEIAARAQVREPT